MSNKVITKLHKLLNYFLFMDKDFFSKLAAVGPDGKFSTYIKEKENNRINNHKKSIDFSAKKEAPSDPIVQVIQPIDEPEADFDFSDDGKPEGQLLVDIYQTPISFIIESHVAGIEPESLDVAIAPDNISIRGKRKKKEKIEENEYLLKECFWGRFARSIILPQQIDPDKSHASLKNGILKIVLSKLSKQKQKKLEVREG